MKKGDFVKLRGTDIKGQIISHELEGFVIVDWFGGLVEKNLFGVYALIDLQPDVEDEELNND